MTSAIVLEIPLELTAAMVVQAGVVKDETRPRDLASELHEIVAGFRRLFAADPHVSAGELILADLVLATWRQALVVAQSDTPDSDEAEWISVHLAFMGDDNLYLRWLAVCVAVTGSDLGTMYTEGGAQ
jgi:hypothetical protein